jgi:DNA-binding SARP family transcriptional activator
MTVFRILGPLEVSEGGRPVDVTGGKQRALLAMLLLNANRVVSVERLVDGLWDDDPPETAPKAVQVYVSQLRKLLGHDRVVTKTPGYVLNVDEDELDVDRFRRLAERRSFREALELWRGQPLAEFANLSFARAEIGRLEELRLACVEERIASDLEQRGQAELVGELEALVREHPLRERLRALAMLALYRSGRQAEALDVYQDARRALVEQLGIEPGRALRELHQQILNQDAELEPERGERPGAVPAARAEPVASDPARRGAARELRKTVTVLCASVSAATDARIDPEALRRVLARALVAVKGPVERHGGSIESSSGGTVTAIFGIPIVHEDDARRALRAAAEVAAELEQAVEELTAPLAAELRHGIGVSTGEVMVGGELAPTGQPLTEALRLAQLAMPGDVLFDTATSRLARDVASEPADGAGFRLLEATVRASVPSGGYRSPMVGRFRERRRLHDAFAQAVGDRSVQLFTVLGAAGVGKSRLVEEFLEEVAGGAVVARGRCLPYGEGITYWPVLEVVKELAGLDDSDSPDEAIAKLGSTLAEEDGGGQAAERLAEMIGLAEAAFGGGDGFEAVQTLVESFARRRPVIVVFDDVHWGEATFLDLVEHLADWTRDAPLLLLCLARPELLDIRSGWAGGKLNATTILLEPLSEAESVELIDNLDGAALDEAARQRIVAAAEGNPLFVEEMLALVVEGGAADGDIDVPPTIQALLGARLDRLGDEERAVIEPAAVAGKVFYAGAVAELLPASMRDSVSDAFTSLVRKELIRPDRPSLGERTYRFRHMLIRDAAYDSIPKQARAALHEGFGRWLVRTAGGRASEYEEVVGYHLEQAYHYRRELGATDAADSALAREAAERLGRAARRAFVRSDGPGGVNLVSRAVALLAPEDPLRVELVPNVRAIQGLGDMTWADRVLTEAVEAAATSGDRLLAAQALVQRGFLRLFTEADVTPEELLDAAGRSITVFEQFDDQLGLGRAWRLKAQAYYLARQAGACADASERALEHIHRAGDRFEEQEVVEWLVIALLLGPVPADEAVERCRRALALTSGATLVEATIAAALAPIEAMRGNLTEADDLLDRALEIMSSLGEWMWIISFWQCFILSWKGDPARAERELLPAYDALRNLGEKSHFSSITHALSTAMYAQGRYVESEAMTRECEEASRPNDVHSQILWRSIRAMTRAHAHDFETAMSLAREAIAYASESDFYPARADAHLAFAEVLELAGDMRGAADALAEAIRFCELKGNVFVAGQARGRLAVLEAELPA